MVVGVILVAVMAVVAVAPMGGFLDRIHAHKNIFFLETEGNNTSSTPKHAQLFFQTTTTTTTSITRQHESDGRSC